MNESERVQRSASLYTIFFLFGYVIMNVCAIADFNHKDQMPCVHILYIYMKIHKIDVTSRFFYVIFALFDSWANVCMGIDAEIKMFSGVKYYCAFIEWYAIDVCLCECSEDGVSITGIITIKQRRNISLRIHIYW